MSTRTNLRPQPVITNGDMSTATITSSVTILQSLTKIGYGCSWTGTSPVGTLAVQVSNDYSLDPNGVVLNAGTWSTMTLDYQGAAVQSIPVSGNTGTAFIDVMTGAYASRLVFTKTSGTGTLQAIVTGKVS